MNYCRTFFITKLLKTSSLHQQCRLFSTPTTSNSISIPQNIDISTDDNDKHLQVDRAQLKPLPPTFNFAAYVNDSETLKNFVHLGVNLSQLEKRKGIMEFVMKLDFERDVKQYLLFLSDLGIPSEAFGHFFTKNPLIFKESIDDLTTRVYYLQSKRFAIEQIQQIVAGNPYWLSFSTKRIDRRLGYFQKNFSLTGNELRSVAVLAPRLITYNMAHVRASSFSLREEMGFGKDEVKALMLKRPSLWMNGNEKLMDSFDFIHHKLQVPHDKIVRSPELLQARRRRMEERHKFLKFLGLDQFDETKPNYVPLLQLTMGSDRDFVIDTCKSTPETFDNFLKTL